MVEIYVMHIPKDIDSFLLKEKISPLLERSKFSDWNKKITRQTTISMLSYAFVQYLVKQKYEIQNPIAVEYTTLGKPFFPEFPDICFNISHSEQYACVALAKEEVGVDIERTRTCKPEIVARFFHESETKDILAIPPGESRNIYFTQLWALKESYVKFLGTGIANVFNTFHVRIKDGIIRTSQNMPNAYFKIYEQLNGYQISICSSIDTFPENPKFFSVQDLTS